MVVVINMVAALKNNTNKQPETVEYDTDLEQSEEIDQSNNTEDTLIVEEIELQWNDPNVPTDVKRSYLSLSAVAFHPDMLTPAGHVKDYERGKERIYRITFDEQFVFYRLDKIFNDLEVLDNKSFQAFFARYSKDFEKRTQLAEYHQFIKNNANFSHYTFDQWQQLQALLKKYSD